MSEEFNLSEKRMQRPTIAFLKKDIQEFIRRLKEELCDKYKDKFIGRNCDIIDKLSGGI